MNVKDVASPPACRVGVVLKGPQAPFGAPGHRIHWNSAKESFLLAGSATVFDPFDECVQVRRVTLAAELHADQVTVSRILIMVDGVAHFAKIPVKLGFLCANNGELHDGKRRCGEDEQNGSRDDQLKKCETGFSGGYSLTRFHSVLSIRARSAGTTQHQDYTVILLGGSQISGPAA
jgi:hypothetical protein